MKITNCYKTIIKSLCDFTNWTSIYANKWKFDECELSGDEDVTLTNFDPWVPSDVDVPFVGALDRSDTAKVCLPEVVTAPYINALMAYYLENK